ncbi:protein-L-isoaspartate(D-aspartate) O-methyltransferase [Rhodobium orientis]|uniref:Protein-L-isoaspartate O-methyltransferase n=1 Tax=Rhodobium orientis TaxID=34017 RepID=A0A327JRB9_9HYPH|nr:protein-L-isoaspartate(D-aspartate) O-methyltransferase [Rhodobium orientis]MBB4302165.1 protein-L-isoaspartate(D-aspartate) O-methyltransferase [Rhodobium orientis]MBK5948876.1 protein-L-isoaspartate O-methyltransferase [Rhodobium orientis]RAI27964.1 protein-L-isoaspartate O-methyltransferase [Rhodobium orientis]
MNDITDDSFDSWDDSNEGDRIATAELILLLRRQGIRDARVLSALERVPRRLFLSANSHTLAYADRALPIECGQTISAPSIVALMTEALEIEPTHRVLEIGTGSGYQAAVLSKLAEHVDTMERYRTLMELAEQRMATLGITNVNFHLGDGFEGLPEKAPFDRIIVTAAAPELPQTLAGQLVGGGIMVVPVGPSGGIQELIKVRRRGSRLEETALCSVRFVPMVPGVASRL